MIFHRRSGWPRFFHCADDGQRHGLDGYSRFECSGRFYTHFRFGGDELRGDQPFPFCILGAASEITLTPSPLARPNTNCNGPAKDCIDPCPARDPSNVIVGSRFRHAGCYVAPCIKYLFSNGYIASAHPVTHMHRMPATWPPDSYHDRTCTG